ncbi:MAG: hypothetical protein KBF21_04245 [Thermoanaerobaculia bacterium]|nr:hypothetical protein [Thermoanaerobaculia bacterium]MBP9823414.1 hypothetical protein [Thermoanaerobaculia bacterium]
MRSERRRRSNLRGTLYKSVTAADRRCGGGAANLPAQDIFFAHWLPDSRRIALSAGKSSRDAVLIRDFR